MRILVVVASRTGRTQRMAEALAEGARETGADVELVRAEDADPERVAAADALVLGSGVHMGGAEAAMAGFLARTAPLWMSGALIGKVGAAFATSGDGARGGGALVLVSLLAALAEHGCLIVPMPSRLEGFAAAGCAWGPVAWTNPRRGEAGPTERHLVAARSHGRHVAECTARWLAGRGTPSASAGS